MSHFEIISPTSRWYPHNHEIKNMFGLRWQDKFPREGLAPINVPLKDGRITQAMALEPTRLSKDATAQF
jgi:hypothetical protein